MNCDVKFTEKEWHQKEKYNGIMMNVIYSYTELKGNLKMKYRKKPVVIDAVRLTRESFDVVLDFVGEHNVIDRNSGKFIEDSCYMEMKTSSGIMIADENDWIIKGSDCKGGHQVWPVSPKYFAANYEEVKENGN